MQIDSESQEFSMILSWLDDSTTDLMWFPTATYDEERRLNQGVYETKNELIMVP